VSQKHKCWYEEEEHHLLFLYLQDNEQNTCYGYRDEADETEIKCDSIGDEGSGCCNTGSCCNTGVIRQGLFAETRDVIMAIFVIRIIILIKTIIVIKVIILIKTIIVIKTIILIKIIKQKEHCL